MQSVDRIHNRRFRVTPDMSNHWRTPMRHTGLAAIAMLAAAVTAPLQALAADAQTERGKYLVNLAGCSDCHTPGTFLGKPDMTQFLGGSDVGFAMPGLGVFVGRNLTPDKETGLGLWTRAQIIAAITAGKRPDGRQLAPIMPWLALAKLTKADATAIAAYLQSLPAVKHAVPGPFGPTEKATVFVFDVLPADVYNSLPPPPAPPPAAK
jgi:mono/diheme cytochrome c family protein